MTTPARPEEPIDKHRAMPKEWTDPYQQNDPGVTYEPDSLIPSVAEAKRQPSAKPLEGRAEVDSLESLQHQRRLLAKRYATLGAKFRGGQQALAETNRANHRALIAKLILEEMRAAHQKEQAQLAEAAGGMVADKPFKEPSEAALERMARADERHQNFVAQVEKDHIEYITIDIQMTEITERIQSRRTELECYKAELFLQGGN